MRKLIAWDLMTLDGCFEGPAPWSLDFHMSVWGEELEAYSLEQGAEAGTLLFGRATYEGMAAHWSTAEGPIADFMNGVEKVIASRSLAAVDWNNSRLLKGELPASVAALKQEPGKDIFVFGSAGLTADLLRHGLIDEFRICLAPVVLGAGQPLFKPSDRRIDMTLLDARPLKTGGIILRYAVPVGG